jgi:hypothetical protein
MRLIEAPAPLYWFNVLKIGSVDLLQYSFKKKKPILLIDTAKMVKHGLLLVLLSWSDTSIDILIFDTYRIQKKVLIYRTMASVFITVTLVRVPHVAGRPVAGRETDRPPMAWATDWCRRTIFLTEETTGRAYLVDTGAAVSVVPFRGRPATATAYLTGLDNKVILAWGTVRLQLRFGGTTFAGDFVQAAVSKSILGVEFLARHKLLVDAASRRVLDV